jgi:hypothetical protein
VVIQKGESQGLKPRYGPISNRFIWIHFLFVTRIHRSCYIPSVQPRRSGRIFSRERKHRFPLESDPSSPLFANLFTPSLSQSNCTDTVKFQLFIIIKHMGLKYAQKQIINIPHYPQSKIEPDFFRNIYTTTHLKR